MISRSLVVDLSLSHLIPSQYTHECRARSCRVACVQTLEHGWIHVYSMTHRQPAVDSPFSPSPRKALPFDCSSSSTTSCGLTVICTTFAASALNLHSVEMLAVISLKRYSILGKSIYLLMQSYHPITSQSKSIVCYLGYLAVLPILSSTPSRSIPSMYIH